MIVVTTLNGRSAAVNAELVERIHQNPDTTLVLVDGKRLVVRESMAEVIGLIEKAKARALRLAAAGVSTGTVAPRHVLHGTLEVAVSGVGTGVPGESYLADPALCMASAGTSAYALRDAFGNIVAWFGISVSTAARRPRPPHLPPRRRTSRSTSPRALTASPRSRCS